MAMKTKKVVCYECGKEFEVFDSANVFIPKYRCDDCLKLRF